MKWSEPKEGSTVLKCIYYFITLRLACIIYSLLFQKRLEGTKVTVESFMAWKRKFDEERLALKAKVKKEVND